MIEESFRYGIYLSRLLVQFTKLHIFSGVSIIFVVSFNYTNYIFTITFKSTGNVGSILLAHDWPAGSGGQQIRCLGKRFHVCYLNF